MSLYPRFCFLCVGFPPHCLLLIRYAVGHFYPIREVFRSFASFSVAVSEWFIWNSSIHQYSIPFAIRRFACLIVFALWRHREWKNRERERARESRSTCNGHFHNLVNCNHCRNRVATHCRFNAFVNSNVEFYFHFYCQCSIVVYVSATFPLKSRFGATNTQNQLTGGFRIYRRTNIYSVHFVLHMPDIADGIVLFTLLVCVY